MYIFFSCGGILLEIQHIQQDNLNTQHELDTILSSQNNY